MSIVNAEVAEIRRLGRATEKSLQQTNALAAARQDRMLRLHVDQGLTQKQLAGMLEVSPTVAHPIGMSRARVKSVAQGREVRHVGALPRLFTELGMEVRRFTVSNWCAICTSTATTSTSPP